MTSRIVVHLVPHTHWDREWYLPFQAFRMRLVELVDGLLEEMTADGRVRFTLDGQTATVDDFLEIRPDQADRLAGLVADGRLAVGPWRILMDEFLVSGETLVRNLEMGLARAEELGRAMLVGYLPDMFGHIAQMPQILRRAGIADAVVWRGVPAAIDRHVFHWSAPDGSIVRCEYLLGGYGNGRDILALPDRIERKLDIFLETQLSAFGSDEILAMYGEDHSLPLPGYAALVTGFNAAQDRYELRIETLAEYLDATRERSIAVREWTGELRSGARANILMGVVSHRLEVRQAAARAERLLERRAEPLIALHGTAWPDRLLEVAWRRLVDNSAHDSICACSSEETVAQVLTRFAEAEQIGHGLTGRVLAEIGRQAPLGAMTIVNPSPVARSDVVELDLPLAGSPVGSPVVLADGSVAPTQDLALVERTIDEIRLAASEVVPYLHRRMHARELYTYQVNGYRLSADASGFTVTIDVDREPDPPLLDIDSVLEELGTAAEAVGASSWQLRVVARPRRRLLAWLPAPALGWSAARPAPQLANPVIARAASVSDNGISNGLVSVLIDADGTFTIEAGGERLTGVGRLVDGGDVGDSYNYAPPTTDAVIDRPVQIEVEPGDSGPLRASITVIRTYGWPAGLLEDLSGRRSEAVETVVRTTAELRVEEPFLRLSVEFVNGSLYHRLRFHVPLPAGARRTYAEGQFAIVERGTVVEGGHGEQPLATFPAHGLVAADGAAILLDHVLEYELVDPPGPADGSGMPTRPELALTLLRATGLISRDRHPYRDEPAGPVIAAPTGQGLGPHRVSFAVLLTSEARPSAAVLAALEAYRNPFLVAVGSGDRSMPLGSAAGLSIEGPGIVLTSLRRRAGRLEVRMVNETNAPARTTLRGPFAAVQRVDLRGRPLQPVRSATGVANLRLGPWEIGTFSLH
ncbi:MAG: alpha-mannosidase, partial [Candidatus Limnocylindrales bacterium]